MPIHAIVFDAYGTLFDVFSIRELAKKIFPNLGQALTELWRDKQMEYTHLRTISNKYKPFWEITQDALRFACKKLNLILSLDSQDALMSQYARLQSFPENVKVLQQLRAKGFKLAILSNGNLQMR